MASTKNTRAAWGKASKGFSIALLDACETVTKKGAQVLATACEDWLAEMDWEWKRGSLQKSGPSGGFYLYKSGYKGGDATHPWYTGNLHDSFATAITDRGRLLHARYMTEGAQRLQTYKGQIVDGAAAAHDALMRAVHTNMRGVGGLVARLVIGVPYAQKVNEMESHKDYVDVYEKDFGDMLIAHMEQFLPKVSVRPRK